MSGATKPNSKPLPDHTQVLIAGGGPVGLATAVELARRGIDILVIEPRKAVSHARPRCKTINVRTMEHLRRWGLADRLRERAPIAVDWSQDIVFCTSLSGHELSRFTGVFGLAAEGDRFPEVGQQAPQYVLEELLREVVDEQPNSRLARGWSVSSLAYRGREAVVRVVDDVGNEHVVSAEIVIGCDGPRSAVRESIGAAYEGELALRPNFGMVFEAPELWKHVAHGPAIQYWTVTGETPALAGPVDLNGTWWLIALGFDEESGNKQAQRIIDGVAGVPTPAKILSTDPWTARMQLVDRARVGNVFVAGDAAHLNPPFGGHGLNTGIGDAVDLGWKVAAHLAGWGGSGLLDSYELERRPVQEAVIAAAKANNSVLGADLVEPGLDLDGPDGDRARRTVDARIQAAKRQEFHSLDLVLGLSYAPSPLIATEAQCPTDKASRRDRGSIQLGGRLPHAWFDSDRSAYDGLGPEFSLLVRGELREQAARLTGAARDRRMPLEVVGVPVTQWPDSWQADLVLVRPDQHVAWFGDAAPDNPVALIDRVRGETS